MSLGQALYLYTSRDYCLPFSELFLQPSGTRVPSGEGSAPCRDQGFHLPSGRGKDQTQLFLLPGEDALPEGLPLDPDSPYVCFSYQRVIIIIFFNSI